MKLKLFDRILLVILSLAALAVAFVLFGISLRIVPKETALYFVSLFYYNAHNALILAGSGLVVLLIALRLLFARRKPAAAPQAVTTLVRHGEVGSTFITLSAIDTMAQKFCSGIEHVQACHTSVCAVDGGVSIGVRLDVDEQAEVVALSEGLQSSMKEYIEVHTGIAVKEIGVLVENLNAAEPSALPAAN